MELERPRKMELLHTPKSELSKMMRENSLTIDEAIFLFASNKLSAVDIRINAPSICDKLLNLHLRELVAKTERAETVQPMVV